MTPLVIVGAGGHGRETLDIAMAVNASQPTFGPIEILDDDPTVGPSGPVTAEALGGRAHVLAIGDPTMRARMATRLGEAGRAARIVHPAATVGTAVDLGDGVVIAAGARLTTDIRTGVHVHLNPNVVVSHDCIVGDFVSCSPGVILSGGVSVGDRVLLGSGAVVLPGCHVGDDVVVGAGAVITADVAAGTTVVGVPARPTNQR